MARAKSDNEIICTMYSVAAKHARQLADEYLEVSDRLKALGARDELERSARVAISIAESLDVARLEYVDDDAS